MLLFVSQLGVLADHTKENYNFTSTICMNFSKNELQTKASNRQKVVNVRIMGASYEK